MKNPTMTLDELRAALQERGIRKGYASLKRMILTGALPFVTVLNTGDTGRCTYLIPRVAFERWADEYAPLAVNEAGREKAARRRIDPARRQWKINHAYYSRKDGESQLEPYEQAERLAAAEDRRLCARPRCLECGHKIQTRYALRLDSGYLCWGCVDDRRVDSEEEFYGYY